MKPDSYLRFPCTPRAAPRLAGARRGRAVRPLAALALCLATALGVPQGACAQAQSRRAASLPSFDIPAGPLEPALARFASSAGVNLSYEPSLVQGVDTPGLRGSHSVASGLQALLAGTGLAAVAQPGGDYVLRPAPRANPAAGAGAGAGAASVSTLPAIAVIGGSPSGPMPAYAGGQVATGARLGMLGNRDIMQTPFNVTSYTAENIENQQASSIGDALVNDPSVRASGLRGAESEAFMIRGFPVDSLDVAVNGLYGIAPTYRSSAEYAERIEVIKGPTALLTGMSPSGAVGGGINIVPKRAGDEPLTRLTASYVSDAQFGGHLDMGRRFGPGNEIGIRFNGVYRNGDTPIDRQSRERGLGSLALDYRGERLRLSADLIYQQENFDSLTRALSLAPGVGVPDAPDAKINLAQSWEYSEMNNQAAMARAEYDFSDRLTGYASVGTGRGRFKAVTGNPVILNEAGDVQTGLALAKFNFHKHSADAGLQAAFDTGPVSHDATLSATTYTDRQGYAFSFGPSLASNIYDPQGYPEYDFAPLADVPTLSKVQLDSVALADTLSIMDERALLTLGVRHQHIRTTNYDAASGQATGRYKDDAFTPMVGLVIRPWESVSFYGNYIEGLAPGETAPLTAANAGEAFAPYKSKQYEVGVKYDGDGFGATLSAFQISRPSANLDAATNVFSVNGKQRNRGIEISAFGQAAPGLRVLGGVAFYDAELTRNPDPALVGNDAIGVPNVQANLGVEWDVPQVPGLTLIGTALYTGRQYLDQANDNRLPSWTRFDAGLRYRTRIASHETVLRFTVQNLFGRDYWAGTSNTGYFYGGAPRTFLLSASIDF